MSDEEKTEWSNMKSFESDGFIEEKQLYFDLNNLHPEAQRRLQMLGLLKMKANGELEEASEEEIDAILRKTKQNEDPDILADKYMMRHRLYEQFKTMTAKMVISRPSDPVAFMINDLEKQVKEKTNS